MSVIFNGKSGEVEGDKWNLMASEDRTTWRSRSSGKDQHLTSVLPIYSTFSVTEIIVNYNKAMICMIKSRQGLRLKTLWY